MVCQLRPLVYYRLGLNNSPRTICLTPRKSCVTNLWRNKQGSFRCQMAEARFHSLDKTPCSNFYCGSWQSTVFRLQIATNKITVLWIVTDCSLNLRADCHRPDLAACIVCHLSTELGNPQCTLPRGYSCCGKLQYLTAELSKWVNSSTHHFASRCLMSHSFIIRDFSGAKMIRGGLLCLGLN
jgi:hypothetical protein